MAEEKAPGIVKTMKFGDEEFEVPFAKGNPGKTREELDEIKRKRAARLMGKWLRPWAIAPHISRTLI